MNKYTIIPHSKEDIDYLLDKDIKGLIIGVKNLSIYDYELDIDSILDISNNTNRKIIIAINKMIHNNDLDYVKEVLSKIKNTSISIMFHDLGVLNIIKKINLNNELIIYGEHLNLSIGSNSFYQEHGINSSFISSDITYEEINAIKKKTNMNIYYTVYGYLPIFYSRRSLITNYFKYINEEVNDNKYYIFDKDNKYLIKERDYGTIIYSPLVNILNDLDKIKDIDNYVVDLSYIEDKNVINNILEGNIESNYKGFFNTKTTYKIKEEE